VILSVKPLYLFFRGLFSAKKTVVRKTSEEGIAAETPPVDNAKTECRAPS